MRKNNRKTGTLYEKQAGKYLEKKGCEVLAYNYRCKAGEIDIIAKDGEYLVFCEVKYRTDNTKGFPEEAVDFRKQRILSKCALQYLTVHGLTDQACRFDVAAILKTEEGIQIQWYQNAFEYCG